MRIEPTAHIPDLCEKARRERLEHLLKQYQPSPLPISAPPGIQHPLKPLTA